MLYPTYSFRECESFERLKLRNFWQAEWFTKAVLGHTRALLWKNPASVYKISHNFPSSGLSHDAGRVAAESKVEVASEFARCIQNGNVDEQMYFITMCCLHKNLLQASPILDWNRMTLNRPQISIIHSRQSAASDLGPSYISKLTVCTAA